MSWESNVPKNDDVLVETNIIVETNILATNVLVGTNVLAGIKLEPMSEWAPIQLTWNQIKQLVFLDAPASLALTPVRP